MAVGLENLDELVTRVTRLEDEQGILDTLYRYGQCLDYRLMDDWVDCFTDDAVWGAGTMFQLRGHAELAAYAARPKTPGLRVKHMLAEPRIALDGDRCSVESYFFLVEGSPTGPFVRTFGRYRDRMMRCADGRWRFEERIIEVDETHPLAAPIHMEQPAP